MKIKCMRKVKSKSENLQRPATVRKFHAYEMLESPGYENWVRTKYSGITVVVFNCPSIMQYALDCRWSKEMNSVRPLLELRLRQLLSLWKLLLQATKLQKMTFFFLIFALLTNGQSVTVSDFGPNGPRFESSCGRCVESLDKALYSHCPQEKPSH